MIMMPSTKCTYYNLQEMYNSEGYADTYFFSVQANKLTFSLFFAQQP